MNGEEFIKAVDAISNEIGIDKEVVFEAMELALEGKFNVLVTLKNGRLGYVSLEEVVGNNKEIGARSGGTESTNIKRVTMDDDLVKVARDLDICLGD